MTEKDPVPVADGENELLADALEDTDSVPLEVKDCEPDVVALTDADTEIDGDEEVVWQ